MTARLFGLRLFVLSTALALALTPATAARAPQNGQQKTALVTVVDPSGVALKDLSAKDFIVREDNAPREVTAAELVTEPLFITLLVDTSVPPIGVAAPTQDLRRALANFVGIVRAANADAQMSLIDITASVTTVKFSTEDAELNKAIQRLVPSQMSSAVLLEALVDACKSLKDKPSPRRAIVSIDFNSQEGSAERTMRKAAEDVRQAGVTVWAASIRGTANSAGTRDEVLNAVTQSSGGLRLTALEPSGLDSMLRRIANSLASQYSVTFARPGGGNLKPIRAETTRGAKVLLSPWMR
jgi:hypothetical protein